MRSLRRYLGRRIVAQLGDNTLDGTVHDVTRELVVLVDTKLITGNEPVALDGEVAVPSDGINWAQVI